MNLHVYKFDLQPKQTTAHTPGTSNKATSKAGVRLMPRKLPKDLLKI